jgi:hypothetical protein
MKIPVPDWLYVMVTKEPVGAISLATALNWLLITMDPNFNIYRAVAPLGGVRGWGGALLAISLYDVVTCVFFYPRQCIYGKMALVIWWSAYAGVLVSEIGWSAPPLVNAVVMTIMAIIFASKTREQTWP